MYMKTNWKDEILNEVGEVIQEGTALSADNLNNIETGIEATEKKIDDFLKNGGKVGGNIDVKCIENTTGNFETGSKTAKLVFKEVDEFNNVIEPKEADNTDLGSPNRKFKDIYVGDYYRSSPGHSSLPNELKEQWGTFTVNVGANVVEIANVEFPVLFKTKVLDIQITNINPEKVFFAGKVVNKESLNSFKVTACKVFGEGTVAKFSYRAIGY